MERPIDLSMFDCDVDGPERCGVIFEDDNGAYYVVEVPNRATDTHDNFTIVEEDLPELPHPVVGIVHTHPSFDYPFPSKTDLVQLPLGLLGIVYQPVTKSVVWYSSDGKVSGQIKIKD